MLDRLDFCFVPETAPAPPRLDYSEYERVVWAGVSFRRFAKIWTPERHRFFRHSFKEAVFAVLACAARTRRDRAAKVAKRGPGATCAAVVLGDLPDDCLYSILAYAASKKDARIDGYDDLATVNSGSHHLFLPAPGSSGIREQLFDATFGLR